jgi:DNA modification methylase
MQGELADLLVTDPPYGVGYVGRTDRRLEISNDDRSGLAELLFSPFSAADRVLRPGAPLYVFHPAGPNALTFWAEIRAAGWQIHQGIVWVKDTVVLGHSGYMYRHEPIVLAYKPGRGRRGRGSGGWYGGNDKDSVLEVPRPAVSREHPTAKPVELISMLVCNSSRRGKRVLDPFAGSGSTLVAAQELGRVAHLVEIDPAYADVILSRYETLTGEEAKRVG